MHCPIAPLPGDSLNSNYRCSCRRAACLSDSSIDDAVCLQCMVSIAYSINSPPSLSNVFCFPQVQYNLAICCYA